MRSPAVITSIFPPSKAICEFSKIDKVTLIVVGDKKTPQNWHQQNCTFLSLIDQKKSKSIFIQKLPENHYCRKMAGYLYAIQAGADQIYDTDDDNIPYQNWSFPDFMGSYLLIESDQGFVNVYNYFTDQFIWPRGFPLHAVKDGKSKFDSFVLNRFEKNVGIWQGLADGNPDVDAIYRLILDNPCIFEKKEQIVLDTGTICPFNSQNTLFSKRTFPLLYLPVTVSFRFTDILRGLVAQPILWAAGLHLGFTQATVFQERNPHNYLKDFESEVPCYLNTDLIIKLISPYISKDQSICENLLSSYQVLAKNKIVSDQEIDFVKLWIREIS